MHSVTSSRSVWWTIPAALALWLLVARTVGVIQLGRDGSGLAFYSPHPRAAAGLLVAALALAAFGDHLRQERRRGR